MPQDLLLHPNTERLAIALLHFLWQGTFLAALYGAVVAFLIHRPKQRYLAGIATMGFMAICVPMTYSLVEPSAFVKNASAQHVNDPTQAADSNNAVLANLLLEQSLELSPAKPPDPGMRRNLPEAAIGVEPTWIGRISGLMVLLWLAGTMVCSLRLVGGAIALECLTRRATTVSVAQLRLVERLGGTLGLRRLPQMLVSSRVSEAIATGFFRPVIVFPAAWLSELPPSVIEAVLAHELAHIRRHDLWVNLLQRAVEAVLFFHPAVWWVSRQVRSDREMCCDALAVAATGQKVSYVRALETVARRASREPAFGLATGIGGRKMQLLARVRHVLGLPAGQRAGGFWAAGVLALAVPCGLWALSGPAAPKALAQDERDEAREREERAERRERDRAEREERREREERGEREAERRKRDKADRDERRERDERDRDRARPKRERGNEAEGDRDRKLDIELRFENDQPAREKQRRAAEEQRRRAEEKEREARMALDKQQRDVHQAIERAQVELKQQLAAAQEKLSREIRRAEENGEKEKAQALWRQFEKMRDEAAEQAKALNEKLDAAKREMRGAFDEKREVAERKGGEMREMAGRMQKEFAEQQRAIAEKLEAAQQAGDKAAIQKLHVAMEKMHADQALMQQKIMQSLREISNKDMPEKIKGQIWDRAGMPGGQEAQREMMQMIKDLRNEVQELRREVRELRDNPPKKKSKDQPKDKNAAVPMLEDIPYVGQMFRKQVPAGADVERVRAELELIDKANADKLYKAKVNDIYEQKSNELVKVKPDKGVDVKKSLEIDVGQPRLEKLKNVEIEFTNDLLKNKLDPIQQDKGSLEKLKADGLDLQKLVPENSLDKLQDENSAARNQQKNKSTKNGENDKNNPSETAAPNKDQPADPVKP